jgi:hypothetical protein
MENIVSTFTNNSLTRYYEERINYLEGEKERLTNEARADFLRLDFWIYAQRIIETYVMFHKESNHEFYADIITTILKMYEAHEENALDTSINKLRLEGYYPL